LRDERHPQEGTVAKKKPSAKQRRKRLESFLAPFRVTKGRGFRLSRVRPDDSRGVKSKEEAREILERGVEALAAQQDKLYAQDQWGVLLVFQAMDAAGKDGAIKHVMSGVNPQGCQVYAFKAPTSEELDHDFLWRTSKSLPERGRIGIFNRSYYEEVLVVKVHQDILAKQKLPAKLVTKRIWDERYEDIRSFERYLARQGYLVLKFFLHVSKGEQKRRFLERLDRPEKNWKFSLADAKERGHWGAYQKAYEEMIRETAAPHAPWYVVPADKKWFTRLVVAAAIHDAIEGLKLHYPQVDEAKKKELGAARAALGGNGKRAGESRAGK
jgi:PPK2 family polyphosphate:nucleotide phosphotransferase